MNKDTLKGGLILLGVALAVALFCVVATDNGWQKLWCVLRALAHGVSLSNIRAVCL